MTAIRIVLTLVFGFSLSKAAGVLSRDDSMDLLILRDFGVAWMFWLLVPLIAVALIGALVFVWRPSPILYGVAQAAVILELAETVVVSALAALNPGIASGAFVTSRNSRGLPVRDEVLRMIEQPTSHIVSAGIAITLGGLWLYLLYLIKNKSREAATTANASQTEQASP